MKKGAVSTVLIGIVVAAMFGIIGLQMWNGMITPMTTTYTVTGESLGTVTNGTTYNLAHDNLQSFDGATAYNATDGTKIADLTSSDYVVTFDPGTWTLVNSDYDGDNITVDYTWADSSYIENGITRIILTNLPILLGVGLLILAVTLIKL